MEWQYERGQTVNACREMIGDKTAYGGNRVVFGVDMGGDKTSSETGARGTNCVMEILAHNQYESMLSLSLIHI